MSSLFEDGDEYYQDNMDECIEQLKEKWEQLEEFYIEEEGISFQWFISFRNAWFIEKTGKAFNDNNMICDFTIFQNDLEKII